MREQTSQCSKRYEQLGLLHLRVSLARQLELTSMQLLVAERCVGCGARRCEATACRTAINSALPRFKLVDRCCCDTIITPAAGCCDHQRRHTQPWHHHQRQSHRYAEAAVPFGFWRQLSVHGVISFSCSRVIPLRQLSTCSVTPSVTLLARTSTPSSQSQSRLCTKSTCSITCAVARRCVRCCSM